MLQDCTIDLIAVALEILSLTNPADEPRFPDALSRHRYFGVRYTAIGHEVEEALAATIRAAVESRQQEVSRSHIATLLLHQALEVVDQLRQIAVSSRLRAAVVQRVQWIVRCHRYAARSSKLV
jgi:hypothetical protein